MTIVDSLKAKGSTGGNNIAEAIKNLPIGGEFVIHKYFDETEQKSRLDKTFAQILNAIRNGLNPVIYHDDPTDPETYFSRYKFPWYGSNYDTNEITDRNIIFVGYDFAIVDTEAEGRLEFFILYEDDTLKSGWVTFGDFIHIYP